MTIPDFRAMREQIEQMRTLKDAVFPVGSMVQVDNERFHGVGLVDRNADCPLEKLAVRVESQNTWWYPLEDCTPFHGKLPTWIRQQLRYWKIKRVDSKY